MKKELGKIAYEFWLAHDVKKKEASLLYSKDKYLVKNYILDNNLPKKKKDNLNLLYTNTTNNSSDCGDDKSNEVTIVKCKGLMAYEYYMNNDVSMREASTKFGSQSLCHLYARTHNLPKKDTRNLGKRAYQYYIENRVTKKEASKKFGCESLVRNYIKGNNIIDRKTKSQLAYEYYMKHDITKAEACRELNISGPSLRSYMNTHKLPDKKAPIKSKSKLAYDYYITNDVSKADACRKFGLCTNAVALYIKHNKLSDKK